MCGGLSLCGHSNFGKVLRLNVLAYMLCTVYYSTTIYFSPVVKRYGQELHTSNVGVVSIITCVGLRVTLHLTTTHNYSQHHKTRY